MTPENVGSVDGVGEATAAFQATLDAESPSRSKRDDQQEKAPDRQDISDLFPRREMDRREREGGADDEPDVVKQRRSEARAQQREDDDEPPRDPRDEDDEEDEEDDDDDEAPEEEVAEDEDEGEEYAPAEFDPDMVVRLTVDGAPIEVSLGEALKGYTRTETFHRRMSELGQGVQALNTAKDGLVAREAQFAERNQALEEMIQAFMPQEPDWRALYAQDPGKAAVLRFEWDEMTRKLSQLQQGRYEAFTVQQQHQNERLQHFVSANRAALANQHPEWKQEKVWRRDNDSMRRTAREAGYTDEEMKQLYDARAVEILLKASRYDRMMAAKPRPVRNTPTKQNGATPRSRNVSRTFDRAEKRLSRSGSVSDAAAVFESILDRER